MNDIGVLINQLRNLGIDLDSEHPNDKRDAEIARRAAHEIDMMQDALINARANARKDYKMTLRKFAAFCGVSPTFISKWTDVGPQTEPDIICER